MTYYASYRDLELTCHERPDGTWSFRFVRGSTPGALHIRMGDTVTLTDKAGTAKLMMRVGAFVPHVQYGKFTRSGHVVPDWVQWV